MLLLYPSNIADFKMVITMLMAAKSRCVASYMLFRKIYMGQGLVLQRPSFSRDLAAGIIKPERAGQMVKVLIWESRFWNFSYL